MSRKCRRFVVIFALPLLLALVLPALATDKDRAKERLIAQITRIALERYHLSHKPMDDKRSSDAFDEFLKRIDSGKRFLFKKDVEELNAYREQMDDELKQGRLDLMRKSNALLQERVREVKDQTAPLFKTPFTFDKRESFETDPEKRSFPTDEAERADLWRRMITLNVLDRILAWEGLLTEAKAAPKDAKKQEAIEDIPADFAAREIKARKESQEAFDALFRSILRRDSQDRLNTYLNAITSAYDPHTAYMPPRDEANFNIDMSGSLEGIGALLREKGDHVEIVEIIPGGAAWEQGDLEAKDQILKVGQGDEPPVNVVGVRLSDAVQLIRGPKGSIVRLTVKKKDGRITVIPIRRDKIVVEATYAKVAVLKEKKLNFTIGYILLPKFYRDFTSDDGGRNCSDDVANCLKILKERKVDGVILDLRRNSGGSLSDTVRMAGHFIPEGPVVQVKGLGETSRVLADEDPMTLYDGPLLIMTNGDSASASEILAGAMKDYGRAIVTGSTSTHGKGTVQALLPLANFLSKGGEHMQLGALKLTTQVFYRINGSSTQQRGVTPHIVLPSRLDGLEHGERELDHALPWQKVSPVNFSESAGSLPVDKLLALSNKRVESNPAFARIRDNVRLLKERRDRTSFSLHLPTLRKRQEDFQKAVKATENDAKNPNLSFLYFNNNSGFPSTASQSTDPRRMKDLEERLTKVKDALLKDPQLTEAIHILKDYQVLKN